MFPPERGSIEPEAFSIRREAAKSNFDWRELASLVPAFIGTLGCPPIEGPDPTPGTGYKIVQEKVGQPLVRSHSLVSSEVWIEPIVEDGLSFISVVGHEVIQKEVIVNGDSEAFSFLDLVQFCWLPDVLRILNDPNEDFEDV